MADYIYLLQTRLTPAQQSALAAVRDAARARNLTVFLVVGAVRDLTSGSPIRDLDVVVQGSAPKLKKDLEKMGGVVVGESDASQSLFFHFPGGVRLEVGSTLSITYPKPGKPVAKPASILDDLRRRDFTANAMAISLNEGSYGLLMDPLNGIADIENRELRLVSNYGFIEDPARMIRAARFSARLGWHMEDRTQARYDAGKQEHYIAAMNATQRGYETEEIVREEDPLRVLRRLESEGWMKHLFPAWTSAKVNEAELTRLRDIVGQLASMGIYPDPSAAYFPLLTAKLAPKEVSALKKSFARPGFVKQVEELDAQAKAFGTQLMAKEAAAPSAAWKLLGAAVPEHVLWLAYSSKSAPVQAKFKAFFGEWPQARQRIPYTLMQEMRITPDLPGYDALVEQIFFAIMDGKLETPEAAKAFLEPFSPPAPPPPINLRRRAVKRETKPTKSRAKKVAAVEEDSAEGVAVAGSTAAPSAPAAKPGKAIKVALPAAKAVESAAKPPVLAKKVAAKVAPAKKAVAAKAKAPAKKAATKSVPAKKVVASKKPPLKAAAKGKVVAKKAAAPAKARKVAAKAPVKSAKVAAKRPVAKSAKAKAPVKKVAAKKPAPKAAAKGKAKAKPAKGRR
jgi:tRNA nucleotidyltransferase (CCA-adding enzyme)